MKKYVVLLLVLLISLISAQEKSLSLTVYNSNIGVVRDIRSFDLKKGESEIKLTDVATEIDPTSVNVNFNGTVIRQNYRYDLVSIDKILENYIDKNIELIHPDGTIINGILLSSNGNQAVIKKTTGGLLMINNLKSFRFSVDELPEGLITKPTLVWNLFSEDDGNQDIELTYHTNGINWHAEYIATLNEDNNKISLTGWLNLDNKSGKTYKNAKLKVMAGDINRVYNRKNVSSLYSGVVKPQALNLNLVEEKKLFEYHIYTVNHPTTIANNEMTQITLFKAQDIPVEKKYVNTYGNDKIDVRVSFKNTKENNLGIPLPKGKVRVNQQDYDNVEFIGEDRIDHVPENGSITLNIGKAFDITIDEVKKNKEYITDEVTEEDYEITINNSKDENVIVEVYRFGYGKNWKVFDNNIDVKKLSYRTFVFYVKVPAKDKTVLKYSLRSTKY